MLAPPTPTPDFHSLLLTTFPNKYCLVSASETLSKPLPGMPWPLLCPGGAHSALLKCPHLCEAFLNFPRRESLLFISLAGHTVGILHVGLVLRLCEG